jgi:hypothetical protein
MPVTRRWSIEVRKQLHMMTMSMPTSSQSTQSSRQRFLHNCVSKIVKQLGVSECKFRREREREREGEGERETFSLRGNFSIICNHLRYNWCFGWDIWKVQFLIVFIRYGSGYIRQILNGDLNK